MGKWNEDFNKRQCKKHREMLFEGLHYPTYGDILQNDYEKPFPNLMPKLYCSITTTSVFSIKNVIFHDPATIVYWTDGTKTVVKCDPRDTYNKETGLAMCYMKKALGNKGNYNKVLRKALEEAKRQGERE